MGSATDPQDADRIATRRDDRGRNRTHQRSGHGQTSKPERERHVRQVGCRQSRKEPRCPDTDEHTKGCCCERLDDDEYDDRRPCRAQRASPSEISSARRHGTEHRGRNGHQPHGQHHHHDPSGGITHLALDHPPKGDGAGGALDRDRRSVLGMDQRRDHSLQILDVADGRRHGVDVAQVSGPRLASLWRHQRCGIQGVEWTRDSNTPTTGQACTPSVTLPTPSASPRSAPPRPRQAPRRPAEPSLRRSGCPSEGCRRASSRRRQHLHGQERQRSVHHVQGPVRSPSPPPDEYSTQGRSTRGRAPRLTRRRQ